MYLIWSISTELLVTDGIDKLWDSERIPELPTWSSVSRCYDLLEEIQTLEADRDALDFQEDETWKNESMVQAKAERFLKWLNRNKCHTGSIRLQLNEEKNAYEIYTTEDVPREEFLYAIVSEAVITSDFLNNTQSECI